MYCIVFIYETKAWSNWKILAWFVQNIETGLLFYLFKVGFNENKNYLKYL